MIDLNTAIDIVKKNFKGAKPSRAYMYKKKYYLIIASNGDKNEIDPFYLIDISNGNYRRLNPLEDMKAFDISMKSGPIKTF